MTDELGPILGKRRITEDMVGMPMRIDDIAYRRGGDVPDGFPQRVTHGIRAPGIDHGHATAAHDEPKIGNIAAIRTAHLGLLPVVDVHAGRGVLEREIRDFRRRRRRNDRQRKDQPGEKGRNPASVFAARGHRRARSVSRCG